MSVKNMSPKYRNLRCYRYKNSSGNFQKYLVRMQAKTGPIVDSVMKSVMEEQGYHFDDQTAARSIYSVDKLFDALGKYDKSPTFKPCKKTLSKAYFKVEKMFEHMFGTLTPAHPQVVLRYVRKDASAGAPFFISKELVTESILDNLDDAFNHPCVAYYRTQARMKEGGSFKQTVRLVWGYPYQATIMEGVYARPLIEAFKSHRTPYALGYRKAELGAELNHFAWSNFVGSFDWSSFDSRMPAQIMSLVFKLLRRFFTEVNEEHWNAMVRYFIFTPILMPNGKVYVGKKHGIPSGSYFTNIVGSLANLILMEYLSYNCNFRLDNLLVHGDDSIVASNKELPLREMGDVAAQHFGMVLHPDKQRYTKKDHTLEFLSHMWQGGRPYRDNIETAQHLVYAERGHSKHADMREVRFTRLMGMYSDNYKAWPLIVPFLRRNGLLKPEFTSNYRVTPKQLMFDPDLLYEGRVPIGLITVR